MLALLLALTGAAWTGEEIPAGALDFMYVNQDVYRFGRPAIEEPLTATGAATIIRLQLEHCDYNVVVTLDAADPEKVRAVRSVLTPWLFALGARAVWFRELATRQIIGKPAVNPAVNFVAPVIVPPAPAPTLPEQVKTPVKTSAPRPAEADFAEEGIIVNPQLKVKLRPLGEPAGAPAPKAFTPKSFTTESPATKPLAEELDLLDEPAKAEAVKIAPVEPTKIESTKAEPAKAEPAKVEPAKIEPAKVEPAKIENVATIPAAEKPVDATPELGENAPVKTSATASVPTAPAALVPASAAPALPASPLKKDEESAALPEVSAPTLPELPPFAPLDDEKPAPDLDAGLPTLPAIN
ncbi:hypothetical protein FACS1894139_02050 [Planctomycetales bacterium]|nr:hypothetical protein FACS1894108_01190 [Planctomycetales bacterium]GHT02933.1 hypothetical protein FACS1894139_02050 [Planctomycetales bacterium]